jgi:hypothetical protein
MRFCQVHSMGEDPGPPPPRTPVLRRRRVCICAAAATSRHARGSPCCEKGERCVYLHNKLPCASTGLLFGTGSWVSFHVDDVGVFVVEHKYSALGRGEGGGAPASSHCPGPEQIAMPWGCPPPGPSGPCCEPLYPSSSIPKDRRSVLCYCCMRCGEGAWNQGGHRRWRRELRYLAAGGVGGSGGLGAAGLRSSRYCRLPAAGFAVEPRGYAGQKPLTPLAHCASSVFGLAL